MSTEQRFDTFSFSLGGHHRIDGPHGFSNGLERHRNTIIAQRLPIDKRTTGMASIYERGFGAKAIGL
ncbi:MAG: hypothetical protein DHS20C11_22090 [Lysobacteraceae bacterium]|nr:MAG: hypothetical protein DHS20C11_22090 [Xanthomonadaceae bacterium]